MLLTIVDAHADADPAPRFPFISLAIARARSANCPILHRDGYNAYYAYMPT